METKSTFTIIPAKKLVQRLKRFDDTARKSVSRD